MAVVIAAVRVRERARGVFLGWWIVAAASGIQMLQTVLLMQGYGAYAAVLRDEFGWSKTALSGAASLQRVESGLLGPPQGWLLQRFGARTIMRIGLVILAGGFFFFSQINSLAMFYVAFLTMAVGASLSGFMSVTTVVVQWFERRRATAMALMQTGMSVGGILVPLVAWSLVELGWRTTAIISGVIVLALGLPLVQMMRDEPEAHGLLPDGERPIERMDGVPVAPAIERVNFTPRQALRTRAFWFIGFGHALAVLVVSSMMVHLVVYLKEDQGFSVTGAAVIISIMTAVTMAGQIIGGILGDRFEKRMIAAIAMFGHSAGLFALAWGTGLFWVLVFAVVHGTAWGLRGPLMQAIRADYFGRKSFGVIMGFSSLIIMLGNVAGPLVAGITADATGSYRTGFTIMATLAALGSIFFIFSTKPTLPRLASEPLPDQALTESPAS
ncbi:MAG: MFS transporter [Vicinamibacterales bacterium]